MSRNAIKPIGTFKGTKKAKRKQRRSDSAATSAHNSMMDEVYKPLLRKSRKCSIDFMKDIGPRNYILYDVRYERSFVSYVSKDDDGAIRYGITDYVFDTDDDQSRYFFTQDNSGICMLYAQNGESTSLVARTGKMSVALDPMFAFKTYGMLFIVFNRPTDESSDRPACERLPQISGGVAKATGYITVMAFETETGKHNIVFNTETGLAEYFASIITKPRDGSACLLIFNPTIYDDDNEHIDILPTTFKQLVETIDDTDTPPMPTHKDVPIGVSVYDFMRKRMLRIAREGSEMYGISSIAIGNEAEKQSDETVLMDKVQSGKEGGTKEREAQPEKK